MTILFEAMSEAHLDPSVTDSGLRLLLILLPR